MAACLYMLFTSSINPEREKPMTPSTHYYCEYCGHKFPSVRQLTSATCPVIQTVPTKAIINSMKAVKNQNTPANIAARSSPASK